MEIRVRACDFGLSRGKHGTCALRTGEPAAESSLTGEQSAARALAGVGFALLAAVLCRRRWTRTAGVIAGWFGASHLVAAATRFHGCPELGAIPSVLLRRRVATACGPWDYLDRRLSLVDPAHAGGRTDRIHRGGAKHPPGA